MLLCLPLFLGFAAETQAQTECVSEDLLDHVEARIAIATTDRWERIENALMEQPNPIALFEVKEIYERRKANGWSLNRLDEVIEAMECLVAPPLPDPISESCVSPQLQADVKAYSEETWRESADHVERWLRVLQTFSGTANDSTVMTPAEAQSYADNGWPRWPPVVAALQCLEIEALNESVEAEDETAPQPQGKEADESEDTPQPLQAEETPMPQQSPTSTRVNATFTVYWAGGVDPSSNTTWEINENGHWEGDVILSFVAKMEAGAKAEHYSAVSQDQWRFCLPEADYRGDHHNDPSPIRVWGFEPRTSNSLTGVVCTEPATTGGVLNAGWRDDSGNAVIFHGGLDVFSFSYETKILIRDNNVVEAPFSIHDLAWEVRGVSIEHSGGIDMEINGTEVGGDNATFGSVRPKQEIPETSEVPDRVAYRLKRDQIAWPDYPHGELALGDGSSWNTMRRDDVTCGVAANNRWTDRADVSTNSYVQDLVRADSPNEWLPDHCYPTKQVVEYPLEGLNDSSPTVDASELPTITEDDVSWFDLHKPRGGEWIVSVSKPVLVTDTDSWRNTSDGLILRIETELSTNENLIYIHVLIPATDGIVADVDYILGTLDYVTSNGSEYTANGTFASTCAQANNNNATYKFLLLSPAAGGLPSTSGKLRGDGPAVGTDLCR